MHTKTYILRYFHYKSLGLFTINTSITLRNVTTDSTHLNVLRLKYTNSKLFDHQNFGRFSEEGLYNR